MATGMFVEVTNVSDGPGRTARQIGVYNRKLDPGETLRIPAELVDDRLRETIDLAVGPLPSWYTSFKARRSPVLNMDQLRAMHDRKSAKKPAPPAVLAELAPPSPAVPVPSLSLTDEVPASDEMVLDRKKTNNPKR